MSINPYEASQKESNPVPKSFPLWAGYLATVFAVVLCGGLLYAILVLPFARRAVFAHRSTCRDNMRRIALGLQLYHDTYQAFPPAYTVDEEGKPMHSWRALLLPYVDEKELYDTIDLSKPWDDPVNAKVTAKDHFFIYQCPLASLDGVKENYTTYLASVGPNAAFEGSQSRKRSDYKDGTSFTLMVIEAPVDKSVPWMSPQDADETMILSMNEKSNLSHKKTQEIAAIFADGNSTFLIANLPAEKRRAMISIAGDETVELDK